MTASQTAVQIQGQCNVQAHSAETENNKEVRDEDVTLHQNKETFPSTNSFEGLQKIDINYFPKDPKDCGTSHVASMTLCIASSISSVHEEIGNSQDLFSTPSDRSENHIHTKLCHEKLRCCHVSPCSKKPYKRAKISKDASMNLFKKGSNVHDDFEKANKTYQAYSSITKTELLQRCTDSNIKYHILVTVMHPCHVKEIKLKSGPKAGSQVPLATLVVTDQSGIEMKLILWRAAAFWALTVFPGDVILVTAVTVHEDKWHGEKVLQTTFASKLLNLGFCSTINPQQCLNIIDTLVLQDMLNYISCKCSHLMNIPPRRPQTLEQVVHVELGQLQPDMIAHVIVKVTDITVLTESVYSYKGQRLQKVVLTVEQVKGHRGTLVLWGSGTDWYPQIQKKKDHLWDFRNLIVLANSVSGDLELHTTPWSACECLFNDDKRAVEFKARYQSEKKLSIKATDLQSLLTETYSGEIQLRAHVVSLQLTRGSPTITASCYIDSNTPLEMIVTYLSEIIYTGCGNCECPLKTDINNIYEQCNACLPYNKVKMFYSPAVMTVSDGSNVILVHVSPKLLKKIFLNIPADWMKKAIVPSSDVTYGMVAADACHSLVADPPETYLMTIRSYFQMDENSITLYQEFNLIDLHVEL
ncbi:shieldin complex subunit 2 [Protopterus annectens]|uniref:shieldin complex subunit 2 n=1 Tax=Protopterus annectens TaxID=7888 RepID=UPI001CF9E410|nr:shieldin complex subunit 2 [Protopterus annectens]